MFLCGVSCLSWYLQGYGSTKAGLIGLTRAQAVSLAKHARVNTILPGWIDTSGGAMELTEQDKDWHPVGEASPAHLPCQHLAPQLKAGCLRACTPLLLPKSGLQLAMRPEESLWPDS